MGGLKRLLSLLLISALILSNINVFAEEKSSDISWLEEPRVNDLEGKMLEVVGALEIPKTYKGNTKVSLNINGKQVNTNKDGSFSKELKKTSDIAVKVFVGKDEIVELRKSIKYVMDKTKVNEVIRLIDALPDIEEITLENRQLVIEVRLWYESLLPEERELVTNANDLLESIDKLKDLAKVLVEDKLEAIPQVINTTKGVNYEEVELALNEVRQLIEIAKEVGWTQSEIKDFAKYDKIRGTEVQVIIFKLPRRGEISYVTLEEARPQIAAARDAYDSLTTSEKNFIWTTEKLVYGEERIIELDFLLALMKTTPETFETLLRKSADNIGVDLAHYDLLKDRTPVNEELAGKEYKPGNGWSGGKHQFVIDFNDAVARQMENEAVNKMSLAEAIQRAKELLDTEGANAEALEALLSAIDVAEYVFLNENATQEEIDEAVASLNAAIEEFENSLIPPTNPDIEVIEAVKAYLRERPDGRLVNEKPTQLTSVTLRVPSMHNFDGVLARFSENYEYDYSDRTEGKITSRAKDPNDGTGLPYELNAKRDKTNDYTVSVTLILIKGEVNDTLTYEIFVPKDGIPADRFTGEKGVPAEPVAVKLLP